MSMRVPVVGALSLSLAVALAGIDAAGQGRGRGQAPAPPQTARQAAPIDLVGTWVSVVTEDWRWRMVTPPKGDVASVPVSPEGRKTAQAWDQAADTASGNQCKAFGVGGIMRQPGRLRISWQDDETLKLEFDAGTQTRLLNFDRAKQAAGEKTWQGFSLAQWEGPGVGRGGPPVDVRVTGGGILSRGVPGGGGQGLRGGPPPRQQAEINSGGDLKVVTTNFREGYLRKNGVPYSARTTVREFYDLSTERNGDVWVTVTTIVEDPEYLTEPFVTSTNFKKQADATGWNPRPCTAR